jgi:hypothetical protein
MQIEQKVANFIVDQHGEWDDAGEALLREAAAEIADLRSANALLHKLVENRDAEITRLLATLEPFAAFAEKAEAFVDARAKDGGSPILSVRDFRLADFRRAREALGK